MKILAIIQARCSSSRLPKKVLLPILGKPMLLRQIDRVNKSTLINKIVVATSSDDSDKELVSLLKENQINYFCGSLNNVLKRFYDVSLLYKPKHIVRITGDCPLIDFKIIDQVISLHLKSGSDYTSNTITPMFPDGLDVEVFSFLALEKAFIDAKLPSECEHVTSYIYNHPEKFKLSCLYGDKDLSNFRWTVDEIQDYEFVSSIYEELYFKNNYFSTNDILSLLGKQPNLVKINNSLSRNQGMIKSIESDKNFLNKKLPD